MNICNSDRVNACSHNSRHLREERRFFPKSTARPPPQRDVPRPRASWGCVLSLSLSLSLSRSAHARALRETPRDARNVVEEGDFVRRDDFPVADELFPEILVTLLLRLGAKRQRVVPVCISLLFLAAAVCCWPRTVCASSDLLFTQRDVSRGRTRIFSHKALVRLSRRCLRYTRSAIGVTASLARAGGPHNKTAGQSMPHRRNRHPSFRCAERAHDRRRRFGRKRSQRPLVCSDNEEIMDRARTPASFFGAPRDALVRLRRIVERTDLVRDNLRLEAFLQSCLCSRERHLISRGRRRVS